ncbi:hypothetical protein N7445_008231 [Penicillium cf. griseofulvum]|nr:hypothetical protein N7445_008231 [Penicillium cf. griseofulvum]
MVLARLVAKMESVLDLVAEDSLAVQALSDKARLARKIRLGSLTVVYESQRILIGIPPGMKDPVGELCQLGRDAYDMLFRMTRTSVDYYGYQRNWAPRQAVQVFRAETKVSVETLGKTETLFLNLTSRLDKVETDEELQLNWGYGRQYINKERRHLLEQLNDLKIRIHSETLNAEIKWRADRLIYELKQSKAKTEGNFGGPWESVLRSFGNVARAVKLDDPDDKKDDDESTHLFAPALAFDLAALATGLGIQVGQEAVNMMWQGFTAIPDVDGGHIDKSLLVKQIESIVGDLEKVAESSRAKIVKNPKTNKIVIDETQDKFLVTSKAQIDKFVHDFLGASKIGPQAQKAQKALADYADLLADRNHDKV